MFLLQERKFVEAEKLRGQQRTAFGLPEEVNALREKLSLRETEITGLKEELLAVRVEKNELASALTKKCPEESTLLSKMSVVEDELSKLKKYMQKTSQHVEEHSKGGDLEEQLLIELDDAHQNTVSGNNLTSLSSGKKPDQFDFESSVDLFKSLEDDRQIKKKDRNVTETNELGSFLEMRDSFADILALSDSVGKDVSLGPGKTLPKVGERKSSTFIGELENGSAVENISLLELNYDSKIGQQLEEAKKQLEEQKLRCEELKKSRDLAEGTVLQLKQDVKGLETEVIRLEKSNSVVITERRDLETELKNTKQALLVEIETNAKLKEEAFQSSDKVKLAGEKTRSAEKEVLELKSAKIELLTKNRDLEKALKQSNSMAANLELKIKEMKHAAEVEKTHQETFDIIYSEFIELSVQLTNWKQNVLGKGAGLLTVAHVMNSARKEAFDSDQSTIVGDEVLRKRFSDGSFSSEESKVVSEFPLQVGTEDGSVEERNQDDDTVIRQSFIDKVLARFISNNLKSFAEVIKSVVEHLQKEGKEKALELEKLTRLLEKSKLDTDAEVKKGLKLQEENNFLIEDNNRFEEQLNKYKADISRLKKKDEEEMARLGEAETRLMKSEKIANELGCRLKKYSEQLGDITVERNRLNSQLDFWQTEFERLKAEIGKGAQSVKDDGFQKEMKDIPRYAVTLLNYNANLNLFRTFYRFFCKVSMK